MVVDNFNSSYKKKNILVTGHNGFKGSWLTLWLSNLKANVSAVSLRSIGTSHYDLLKLKNINSEIIDIRNKKKLRKFILSNNPEIIFHLAAQPLVRESYLEPVKTIETNINGTLNLLEVAKDCENLKSIIIITSDKCYENNNSGRSFRESDRMGGIDPYSFSKASVELLVTSYRKSFFNCPNSPYLASARAGNVIGGGDWSKDRLIPDIMNSIENNKDLRIRYPRATRPWQHVLDCTFGYLKLGQKAIERIPISNSAFNFGPNKNNNISVIDVLSKSREYFNDIKYTIVPEKKLYEANLLFLNNNKSKKYLSWKPLLNIDKSLQLTFEWYKSFYDKKRIISQKQLNWYTELIAKNEN